MRSHSCSTVCHRLTDDVVQQVHDWALPPRSLHTLQMSSLAARARSAPHSATATSAPAAPPCSAGAAPSPASLAAFKPPFAVTRLLCRMLLPASSAALLSSGTSVDTPLPSIPPPSTASPRAFWKALQYGDHGPASKSPAKWAACVCERLQPCHLLPYGAHPAHSSQHQCVGSRRQTLPSVCCESCATFLSNPQRHRRGSRRRGTVAA